MYVCINFCILQSDSDQTGPGFGKMIRTVSDSLNVHQNNCRKPIVLIQRIPLPINQSAEDKEIHYSETVTCQICHAVHTVKNIYLNLFLDFGKLLVCLTKSAHSGRQVVRMSNCSNILKADDSHHTVRKNLTFQ